MRVVGVRDWRFNQHIEDIEWLLKLQSADGSASTGEEGWMAGWLAGRGRGWGIAGAAFTDGCGFPSESALP